MDYSKMSDNELLSLRGEVEHQAREYDIRQMAYKILLNSCYGAL